VVPTLEYTKTWGNWPAPDWLGVPSGPLWRNAGPSPYPLICFKELGKLLPALFPVRHPPPIVYILKVPPYCCQLRIDSFFQRRPESLFTIRCFFPWSDVGRNDYDVVCLFEPSVDWALHERKCPLFDDCCCICLPFSSSP